MPRVSIVIPCYNHGIFIQEAINSVFAQTYIDWEIIIVNDGSTENKTLKILNGLNLHKTKLINTPNNGLSSARNTGIEKASGEIILPLDSDDKLGPRYVEKAIEVLDKNKSIGIVYSRGRYFGNKKGIMPMPPFSIGSIFLRNNFIYSSFFYKKDWKKVGGFDDTMRLGFEDWDFWISLLELEISVYKIPECHFYYRIRKDSMYHLLSERQKYELHLYILKKHKDFYWSNIDKILLEIYNIDKNVLKRIKDNSLMPFFKKLFHTAK